VCEASVDGEEEETVARAGWVLAVVVVSESSKSQFSSRQDGNDQRSGLTVMRPDES
jgi:hypothetical protein